MSYIDIVNGDILFTFLSLIVILIFQILFLVIIYLKIKNERIKRLFIIMVVIQQIILILDNFIIGVPLLTVDARNFEQAAWNMVLGVDDGLVYELYTKIILYPIYKTINYRLPSILGEINILFNLVTNITIYKIFLLKKISLKKSYKEIVIILFIPATLLLRSGPLRESIIVLFFILSLYYCFKLEKFFNMKNMFLMIINLVISSLFHSGIIFFLIGYIYIIFKERNKIKGEHLVLLFLIVLIGIYFSEAIFFKIGELSIENLILSLNKGTSIFKDNGSTYLRGVYFNNIKDIIVFLPLKMFYFLFSPTLGMLRGIFDLIVIFLDSLFYYYFIFKVIFFIFIKKRLKYFNLREKNYYKGLLIGIFFVIIIYSLGTGTAGTAIRHRNKIFPILVILYKLVKEKEGARIIENSVYNK